MAPAPAGNRPLTVSELADRIDVSLRQGIPNAISVVGEVSGFRDRTHWYFDLKDAAAVVNCALFSSNLRRVGFTPRDGQQVVARGRVEFYARGGKVTFLVETIEPVGAGALELAFRRLCEELKTLGWFAPERKKRLPTFPRRVAVITSRSSAALQDVLVTMRSRCPAVEVLVADVRVQGERAAPEIAAAIRHIGSRAAELGVDAIIVTRGGGSAEDLWAFNERIVAEAIVRCPVPVVAAIGHETDTTIAELVADERCATPTQAAMRLTPDRAALGRQVTSVSRRLSLQMAQLVRYQDQRLAGFARHPLLADPHEIVVRAGERLASHARRLDAAADSRLVRAGARLDRARGGLDRNRPTAIYSRLLSRLATLVARLAAGGNETLRARRAALDGAQRHLSAVSPVRVLERGYSVTVADNGRIVKSKDDVKAGQRLRTHVADGSFGSIVGDGVKPRKRKPDEGPSLEHGLFSEIAESAEPDVE